jgi:lipoate-protein ligase A
MRWQIQDSGPLSGKDQMAIDQRALDACTSTKFSPHLRFFEWTEPVITYGYLLNEERVLEWSQKNGNLPFVKRPTGGGAVIHHPKDLALSLLWPRQSDLLPSHPRKAYETIHTFLKASLACFKEFQTTSLNLKPAGSCEEISSTGGRFSVCFEDPVCNDVMLNGKKIIGGALRITKNAVLYQGDIHLAKGMNRELLKDWILKEFTGRKIPA